MEQDTSARAIARYHELLQAQPPHQRLAQAMALTRTVRELAMAGIRQRHPGASDDEIRMRRSTRSISHFVSRMD